MGGKQGRERKRKFVYVHKFSLHRSMHRSLFLQAHTSIIHQHRHYEWLQLTPVFNFIIIIITVIILMASCFKLILVMWNVISIVAVIRIQMSNTESIYIDVFCCCCFYSSGAVWLYLPVPMLFGNFVKKKKMTSHSLSLSGLRLVKEKSRYNVNKKIDKTTIKFWTNSHERKKGWNYGCTKEKKI